MRAVLGLTLLMTLPLLAAADGDFTLSRLAHPSPGAEEMLRLPSPMEDYAATRERLESQGLWPGDRTPPENPQVGDTWLWWIWDLGGYPTATQLPCTVRGMGDHIYVVVEDSQWNVAIDQADVDRIVDHFDNVSLGDFSDQGIWDLNTSHFGDPPDYDGLERIFFLYYQFDISADGYFWVYDQYPDGSQPFHSNEADVIYLATDSGDCASDYLMAVGAHEFQHLIHWNQDENEETWADEGLSELAMWLFGNPDFISGFNSQPDNSLVNWGSQWADYIQCYLWTLYIYEQFGGQPVIWDFTHHPWNGMTAYQQVITALGHADLMEDIFPRWSVANFLDDTGIYSGEYGYMGDELPAFLPWRTVTVYPYSSAGSVQDWASEYVRLSNLEGAPRFEFNGSDTHEFRVRLMALDDLLPTVVAELPLDEAQDGDFTFYEALDHDEVVVSVASVTTVGAGSYSFTVGDLATAAPDHALGAASLRAWPNPFNPVTELSLHLESAGVVELTIHDLAGRVVDRPLAAYMEAGEQRLSWRPENLASGMYVARLVRDGDLLDSRKLVLLQ